MALGGATTAAGCAPAVDVTFVEMDMLLVAGDGVGADVAAVVDVVVGIIVGFGGTGTGDDVDREEDTAGCSGFGGRAGADPATSMEGVALNAGRGDVGRAGGERAGMGGRP